MEFWQNKTFRWIALAVLSFLFIYLLTGFWTALFIFAMIGLHEYGHLLAAKYVGIETGGFYFIPLGGISIIKGDPPEQWKKYYIAYGGPLIGLALSALGVLAFSVGKYNLFGLNLVTNIQIVNLASRAVTIWAIINIFNLLPIYPFDGGRLLAAISKHGKKFDKKFDTFLFILSWTMLALTFLYTGSFIILFFAVFGIYNEIMITTLKKKGVEVRGALRIGRLEDNYSAKPPLSLKGKILGSLAYIGLIALFVLSLFTIYVL